TICSFLSISIIYKMLLYNPEPEVISMEEYLAKRKKIREKEKKHAKKESELLRGARGLTPFEYYLVSSSSWS
ncbi:hypothetical protein LI154_12610, partial [[Clostridium] scindens]|uniref:hypothetical protein n=1 Tax=Clostridium scindens (strain JCM 10418 / VPI 12708) TaxID=29347 RepID=UPI001D063469